MVQKETKFVVFKKEELDIVLDKNPLLRQHFETILDLVMLYRITHNKKPVNKYISCNQDEPYADQVWQIILDGEKKKEKGE